MELAYAAYALGLIAQAYILTTIVVIVIFSQAIIDSREISMSLIPSCGCWRQLAAVSRQVDSCYFYMFDIPVVFFLQ